MDTRQMQRSLAGEELDLITDEDLKNQIAEERLRELNKIHGQMQDLGAITQDMSHLVADQGVSIDNIEANTSKASAHTEAGVHTLEQVEKKRDRKRKIVAAVVGIVALGLGIWGGYGVGGLLGFTGAMAAVVGFGIIFGGIIALAVVSLCIYAVVNACRSKNDNADDHAHSLSARHTVDLTPVSPRERVSHSASHTYQPLVNDNEEPVSEARSIRSPV